MIKTLAVAFILGLTASFAHAAEIPAASGLNAPEHAALQSLIDGALKEGSLNYADTIIQPNTSNELVDAFRTYYGLPTSFQVNFTLLGSAAMITRLEQEIGANRVTLDVAAVASPAWAFDAQRKGYMLEYRSPEYAQYQTAFASGLGLDGYFAFNGGYSQVPIWNSAIVDFHGTSYRDVVKAAEPGRFSIGDVAHSESQLSTYVGLRQIYGTDFFKEIAQKKPAFIYRSEVSAQRVLSGQDTFALGGGAARVMHADQKGAKLKILYPKEGFTLLPQSMFILKAAPHPNAAKLWIDFILSDRGQEIICRREALISGRMGFESPVPGIVPEFGSIKVIKVDWKTMNIDRLKQYQSEWESIFTP
jgi:ABC-type Fe3+ transport system substrate-binding protein